MVEMHHPDLVILDINLAGSISGIEVARVLKNKLNIPFVLMSGYSDLLTKEVIEELQPLCALSKPIDYAKLIQCVEENAGGEESLDLLLAIIMPTPEFIRNGQ